MYNRTVRCKERADCSARGRFWCLRTTVRQSPNKHPSVAHTHTPLKRSHEATESATARFVVESSRPVAVLSLVVSTLVVRRRLYAHKEDERHLDAESGEREPARSHTTITRHKHDTMVKRGRKAAFYTPAVL